VSICFRCKREFKNSHSLGLHQRHVREAVAVAARNRLCPDNRTAEEAREQGLRLSGLLAKTGMRRKAEARARESEGTDK
jgi:hypothetical protein